jgi:hypothetical protein
MLLLPVQSQDDKRYPACYLSYMEWIFIALALGVVLALGLLIALRAKRHDCGSILGLFDFGHHKRNELSRRGLFDKAKWR